MRISFTALFCVKPFLHLLTISPSAPRYDSSWDCSPAGG